MNGELDTSGGVELFCLAPADGMHPSNWTFWADLSPFAQGYAEALFAGGVLADEPLNRALAFRDLSPEALALILRDCAARRASSDCVENTREAGRSFWVRRQAGDRPAFPPLTPYLSDDGKVHLREAGE